MSVEQGLLFVEDVVEEGVVGRRHWHCLRVGPGEMFFGCTHVVAFEGREHYRMDARVSRFMYLCPDWVVPARWGCDGGGEGLWLRDRL